PFRLIGGEKAVKEPRRVALSLLFELFGEKALALDNDTIRSFTNEELKNLYIAWSKGINSPYSSSVGRLFDAVASLLGIKQRLSYEGQSAMMLEDLYDPSVKDHYSFELKGKYIDWRPMFYELIKDKEKQKVPSRFINTLARVCLEVALNVGIKKVCLSGGVMQNDPLVSKIKELLTKEGFEVYTHQRVPPNDGGLSLGQAVWSLMAYNVK
ncbi:MAG: carbamoyltransferase HypF, partial [Aquificota bacterium]